MKTEESCVDGMCMSERDGKCTDPNDQTGLKRDRLVLGCGDKKRTLTGGKKRNMALL